MRVTNSDISERRDITEVSAEVDGFRLWYRVPKLYKVSKSGDVFLASALLPAMRQGDNIDIDPSMPVSAKLLKNIALLQEIFHAWNSKELKIIPISASTSPAEPLNTGVISFFSGGVDSMYTLLKHENEISHVVFMHGFDFYANKKGASIFSVGDLRDLAQIAFNLNNPRNAIYAFLKSGLSKTTLEALSNYQISGKDPGRLEVGLINDLNTLITGRLIYKTQLFQGVGLRTQTKELLQQNPQGKELLDLNRLLLEDAFPREISGKFDGVFQIAMERNAKFIQRLGKTLIPVEHNHYAFGYRYNLGRNLTQGSVLGSVALLLGFPRAYIPSSWPYQHLVPLGSHPLTDPLWTNENTEIIHDGAEARRSEKIEKIGRHQDALTNLCVCFDDLNINCGKCSKCLRTMIPLKILNLSSVSFPPLPPANVIRKMRIVDDIEMVFLRENIEFCRRSSEKELYNALSECLRKYEHRRLYAEIDRLLLNGLIKKTYRRLRNEPVNLHRIESIPPKSS